MLVNPTYVSSAILLLSSTVPTLKVPILPIHTYVSLSYLSSVVIVPIPPVSSVSLSYLSSVLKFQLPTIRSNIRNPSPLSSVVKFQAPSWTRLILLHFYIDRYRYSSHIFVRIYVKVDRNVHKLT